ncbi:hypothetical protein HYC85_012359 [Camellia sinensis]|uniref:Non-reducing end beta-L-arabinofuranosidase-like GH127 catalytic domain-containing protein n=1 Tax=Camellia sinensis TaxID=4442 RepID=A0A7J7HEX2_CAMSI|nr:hypothetical protein HYC85_012359 [Camellia sinensis]
MSEKEKMDKENTHRQSSEPEEKNKEREVTTEREDGRKETEETNPCKEHFHPSTRMAPKELAHGHAPFSKYPPMKVLLLTLQNAPFGLDYERDKKFSKASASAQMWASTHNDTLKEKMSALVNALSACPDKMGTGCLSAFPPELFDCFEAIKPVWAPYYTIDKNVIVKYTIERHWLSLNEETSGMNDVLYRLYAITVHKAHLGTS